MNRSNLSLKHKALAGLAVVVALSVGATTANAAGPVEYLKKQTTTIEKLLRQHTWFTEGPTSAAFKNSGTLGDGWLERYGIDAVVHEFNANWIAGLKEYPQGRQWMNYGENLATVFHEYLGTVKP